MLERDLVNFVSFIFNTVCDSTEKKLSYFITFALMLISA